jgi:hypothetical protein
VRDKETTNGQATDDRQQETVEPNSSQLVKFVLPFSCALHVKL